MTVPSASVPDKQHAVSIAAFFLPFALVPWLNPFAGGAMTPGIPLLVGWTCTAFLFAGQPAKYLPRSAAVMLGALVLAVLCGVALDRSWQLLAAAVIRPLGPEWLQPVCSRRSICDLERPLMAACCLP